MQLQQEYEAAHGGGDLEGEDAAETGQDNEEDQDADLERLIGREYGRDEEREEEEDDDEEEEEVQWCALQSSVVVRHQRGSSVYRLSISA
jgi:hypothetical protein